MQVRKVAVAATGVLVTAAAVGSIPTYADGSVTPTDTMRPAVALDYQGKHRAEDAGTDGARPSRSR